MEQQTLRRSFTLEGAGVHSGERGRVTVHPAEADTGRVFHCRQAEIPALAEYVLDTARCTTLGKDGATVRTVEHLLSALAGCAIDNAVIEVEGPEIPILDGSALPFVEAIQAVGAEGQGTPARVLSVAEAFTLEERGSRMEIAPALNFAVEVVTEFADWPEGRAAQTFTSGPEAALQYAREIAPARTFAFRQEVEALLAAGLAKGGSLDNALVITPPNAFSTPLRLPHEWCAHKLLDVLGDLALVGARLQMRVSALRPGHRLNALLANRLRSR